ncbi:cytidylate kinase [Caloranaerobacter azorensis DSM 13643]|uniref:Cytidylate kinase n=1 Tax=Caloranaerobacter azorensis DSM 13643 TaxID=1121264 RepID=A0A1M5TAH6_9FIRM|nr:(d)CMP kinase [Caloranaerobacter azorensis]SHH47676.1 cytidylate kinase [Caloranaerobacter azorensis DSM 13643]
MDKIVIAIDGPAGAGKSTIAKIIAKKLNINYVDTGAMYRALTLKALKNNIDFNDKNSLISLLDKTDIDYYDNHIYLDGKIVDNEIRSNEVSKNVSKVARIKEIRIKLVEIQRKIASNKSVIMDGRDIGSHVLPNADFKFYVTASVDERSHRRYKELISKNVEISLKQVKEEIKQRDEIDKSREFSPLIKSEDAILIDTTRKTVEESVNEILNIIKKGM